MLGALAVLPVALPAAAAGPDPVFAAIERYKVLPAEHDAAVVYISTLEEWQMPPGLEDGDVLRTVQTLCTCLAAALEQSGAAA
jgi:hypothetical protein